MTDFGMLSTGFARKPFTQILSDIGDRQKDKIATTLLTDSEKTVIGNLNNIYADELAAAWEALEIAANGFDPDNAIDYLFKGLAALTGVIAQGPRKGSVPCTIVVGQAVSYPAGTMLANVSGQTSNQWTNREDFTTVGAATVTNVPFISVTAGPTATANAGTLNKISSSLVGWVSITNPTNAIAGQAAETIEELRIRRDESLTITGSSTLRAVIADVAALGGIVTGKENVLDVTAGGLLPHTIQIIVFDEVSTDAQIAQAIYDSKAGGINTSGGTQSTVIDPHTGAVALDALGVPLQIAFTRAAPIAVSLVGQVVSANGFSVQAAKDALFTQQPNKIGQSVIIAKLSAALLSVDGIDDFVQMTLASSLGPDQTTNLTIPDTAIARFDELDMAVTT